jgi:hypothetical protein
MALLFSPETLALIWDTIFANLSPSPQVHASLVDLLTSEAPPLQSAFLQNNVLVVYLSHFLSELHPHHHNPRMCGIASRILLTLFKSSSGAYSARLPGFLDFLMRNITTRADRNLLSDLITSCPAVYSATSDFLIQTLSHDANLLYGVSVFPEILKAKPEIIHRAAPAVVRRLLAIAASPDRSPFLSLQALEVVHQLCGLPDVEAILPEFAFDGVANAKDCLADVLILCI